MKYQSKLALLLAMVAGYTLGKDSGYKEGYKKATNDAVETIKTWIAGVKAGKGNSGE